MITAAIDARTSPATPLPPVLGHSRFDIPPGTPPKLAGDTQVLRVHLIPYLGVPELKAAAAASATLHTMLGKPENYSAQGLATNDPKLVDRTFGEWKAARHDKNLVAKAFFEVNGEKIHQNLLSGRYTASSFFVATPNSKPGSVRSLQLISHPTETNQIQLVTDFIHGPAPIRRAGRMTLTMVTCKNRVISLDPKEKKTTLSVTDSIEGKGPYKWNHELKISPVMTIFSAGNELSEPVPTFFSDKEGRITTVNGKRTMIHKNNPSILLSGDLYIEPKGTKIHDFVILPEGKIVVATDWSTQVLDEKGRLLQEYPQVFETLALDKGRVKLVGAKRVEGGVQITTLDFSSPSENTPKLKTKLETWIWCARRIMHITSTAIKNGFQAEMQVSFLSLKFFGYTIGAGCLLVSLGTLITLTALPIIVSVGGLLTMIGLMTILIPATYITVVSLSIATTLALSAIAAAIKEFKLLNSKGFF